MERWIRKLAQDLACFVCTGQDDWDLHISLACLRYNTGVHEATQLSPFEAMFGIEAFMAWGDVEADRVMEEPYSPPRHLKEHHNRLLKCGMEARRKAAMHYDRNVRGMRLRTGDRVIVWAPDLVSTEGNKVVPSWLGPYFVHQVLSDVSYSLRSDIGEVTARGHPNRIRHISQVAIRTADSRRGVFPDGLRLLEKMNTFVHRTCRETRRWFKVQLRGRASSSWTPEAPLSEAIVRL